MDVNNLTPTEETQIKEILDKNIDLPYQKEQQAKKDFEEEKEFKRKSKNKLRNLKKKIAHT